jgi:hypothetical protein
MTRRIMIDGHDVTASIAALVDAAPPLSPTVRERLARLQPPVEPPARRRLADQAA